MSQNMTTGIQVLVTWHGHDNFTVNCMEVNMAWHDEHQTESMSRITIRGAPPATHPVGHGS